MVESTVGLLCGWLNQPEEVQKVVSSLPIPLFGSPWPMNDKKTVVLSDNFKKVVGVDQWPGPQLIGDCVSMGYGGGVEDLQIGLILNVLKEAGYFGTQANMDKLNPLVASQPLIEDNEVKDILKGAGYTFKEIATESIYGFSRCEIGQQWRSRQDGSVGAWAAKAVVQYGVLNRDVVGPYSGQRAKDWGANGVPDNLEPTAKNNIVQVTSKVTTFEEAAAAIQGWKPVIVCSDRGFSLNRDSQGFCAPSGTWNHCMRFMGVRWDRPGLLCFQRWGANNPNGPTALNQPSNTFWVDADVATRMLRQGDSFTIDRFQAYKNDNFVDWSF